MTDTTTTEEQPKAKNKTNVRGWTSSGGADRSRTFTYESGDQALSAAKRALRTFGKAGRPLAVHLDGPALTLRVYPENGQLDEKLITLMKRRAPKSKKGAGKGGAQTAAAED